jgi:hypothetical protein
MIDLANKKNMQLDQHNTASSAKTLNLSHSPFHPILPTHPTSKDVLFTKHNNGTLGENVRMQMKMINTGRTTPGQLGVMLTQGLHVWTSSAVSG